MKKLILISIIIVFIVLDFMALDDITTGNEPDFFSEYLILVLSIPFIAGSVFFLKKNQSK